MNSCPICKCKDFSEEFVVTREDRYMAALQRDKRIPAKYKVCLECKAMYLSVKNIEDESYFNGAYYGVDAEGLENYYKSRFEKIINLPKGQSDNLERVERINNFLNLNHLSTASKVLDVGAGMGVFLYQFVTNQWQGVAIEPDPNLVTHMKSVFINKNLKAQSGELADLSKKQYKNTFDLITFNRVIEHVAEPVKLLKQSLEYLKQNGVVYVELPDTESYFKDNANNEAFGYGHYVVYSPQAFEKIAQDAGFKLLEVTRVKEPSTKYSIYGFLKRA